ARSDHQPFLRIPCLEVPELLTGHDLLPVAPGGVHAQPGQQRLHLGDFFGARGDHLGVDAEGPDLTGNPDAAFPQRVADRPDRIAQADDPAAVAHEPGRVPDVALDHDVSGLLRDTAPGTGVALDVDGAAAHGRAEAHARVAVHGDVPVGQPLAGAPAGVALDDDPAAVAQAAA